METILPVKLSKLEVLRVVSGPAGSFLCCFHQTASINHTNDTPDLKHPTRCFSVVPTADTQIPTTTIRLMSTISSSHQCYPGKTARGVSSLSCQLLWPYATCWGGACVYKLSGLLIIAGEMLMCAVCWHHMRKQRVSTLHWGLQDTNGRRKWVLRWLMLIREIQCWYLQHNTIELLFI